MGNHTATIHKSARPLTKALSASTCAIFLLLASPSASSNEIAADEDRRAANCAIEGIRNASELRARVAKEVKDLLSARPSPHDDRLVEFVRAGKPDDVLQGFYCDVADSGGMTDRTLIVHINFPSKVDSWYVAFLRVKDGQIVSPDTELQRIVVD
jgi:hypothetical protein